MMGREWWWIHSDADMPWAGLRIATFFEAQTGDWNGATLFMIHNESGDRVGIRVWDDVSGREGWKKLERVKPPSGYVLEA